MSLFYKQDFNQRGSICNRIKVNDNRSGLKIFSEILIRVYCCLVFYNMKTSYKDGVKDLLIR